MIIYKVQNTTLDDVLNPLKGLVFIYSKLYFALSLVRASDQVFLIDNGIIQNIVIYSSLQRLAVCAFAVRIRQ